MSSNFQGYCLTCGAYVGCVHDAQEHNCPYTDDMLNEAFKLVRPDGNWKYPIHATVPADADRALIDRAIVYYTGSIAEFSPNPDGSWTVVAEGYYNAIGS